MWQETLTALTGSENQRSHWANQKNFHPAGSYHPLLHLASALNCFLQSNHHLGCPNGFSCLLLAALSACCFLSPGLPQKPENHLVCCCCCFFWCCCCRVLLIWFGLWCSWLWGGRMKEEEEELWKPWEWKPKKYGVEGLFVYMLKAEKKDLQPLVFVAENSEKMSGICLFLKENGPYTPSFVLTEILKILVLWTLILKIILYCYFWRPIVLMVWEKMGWKKEMLMLDCVFNRQIIENNGYRADWESLVFCLN